MTLWYRVHNTNKINYVFSGEGGLYTAGRWNHLGRKTVYCSQSISLCTLEWLAHHGLSVSDFHYFRFAIDIDEKAIRKFSLKDLPKDWHHTPAKDFSRDFAEEHLFSTNEYLAIAVPSVMVPEELNLVINPLHRLFSAVIKTIRILGPYLAPTRN